MFLSAQQTPSLKLNDAILKLLSSQLEIKTISILLFGQMFTQKLVANTDDNYVSILSNHAIWSKLLTYGLFEFIIAV